jgi:hypothetical protein
VPLTPSERVAFERIKAGEPASDDMLGPLVGRGWARKRKDKPPELTEAGEKALEEDDKAQAARRSAQRPRGQ